MQKQTFTNANQQADWSALNPSFFSPTPNLHNPKKTMKKFSTFALLSCVLLLATSFSASARIRRVNNTGVAAVTNILYTDFVSAHTAAANGDTIMVEPSGTSYGALDCSKRLIVLGPGYFLGSGFNPGLQANPATASFNTFSPIPGSQNSVVAGLTIATVYLQTDNITIQRCYITNALYFYGQSYTMNNCNIRQNYIANMANYYPYYSASNLLVTNNIISSVSFPASYNGEFTNNVVLGGANFDFFNVRNNYFAGAFATASNIHSYNATAQTAVSQPGFTAGNNSQTNVAQANVFVLAPTAPGQFDAWYQLKTGANALRATGQAGTDIGAFGGNAPYKLSGLPAIPAIYQYTQSVNGNTLNVNLSTRSNN